MMNSKSNSPRHSGEVRRFYVSQCTNTLVLHAYPAPLPNSTTGCAGLVVLLGGLVRGTILTLQTDSLVGHQVARHGVASGKDGEANDNT